MDKAQVWVEINEGSKWDGRYLVQELDPLEIARIIDRIAKKYRSAGDNERAILAAQEIFSRRVLDWEISAGLPCTPENKKFLWRKKAALASRILEEADILLEEEVEAELGNSRIGADGT